MVQFEKYCLYWKPFLFSKIKASKSNPEIYGPEGTVKRTEEGGGHERLQISGNEDPNIRTPSYDRKLPDIPNDPNEVYKNSVKVRKHSQHTMVSTTKRPRFAILLKTEDKE